MTKSRELGFTLSEAAKSFASRKLTNAYKKAERSKPKYAGDDIRSSGDPTLMFGQALEILADISHAYQNIAAANEARQNELLYRLAIGELVAYGVRTKPEVERELSEIPKFIFDRAKIEWQISAVEKANNRFEAVRIFERADKARGRLSTRFGRPSRKDDIEVILGKMKRNGWDLSENQKSSCAKIREFASTLGFDTKRGFSDPVLKAAIRRVRDQQ